MRRAAVPLALLLLASSALAAPARREAATPHPPAAAKAGPPHAFLFGVWTGGLFPVLDGMAAQDCKAQPTVVFGRDTVGHTSLLATAFVQRVIETVRTTPEGAEFRFSPNPQAGTGFGCEDPNILHVARETPTTIVFPHCTAFPYPLTRCPTG